MRVCGLPCAIILANTTRLKQEAKEHAAAKKKMKTRAEWSRDAQSAVNKYVRVRDAHLGCISCDKPADWDGQWHAGHYRSVGSAPHLRFDADRNIFRQCSQDNLYQSGNLIEMRKRMIERIGLETVEALEADQSTKHYTIDDLKMIIKKYKEKTKDILNTPTL